MTMDRNDPPRLFDSLETGEFQADAEGTTAGGRVLDISRYRLTTAEILYHMPDHPKLLQTYVWQEMDIAPRFPVLHRFLAFWQRDLDGKLNRVRVAHAGIVGPAGTRFVDLQVALH